MTDTLHPDTGILVDTEIQDQTIPHEAWEKACYYYRLAHGDMHRGHGMDLYCAYTDGLADGMYVNADSLREYVKDAVVNNRPYVG